MPNYAIRLRNRRTPSTPGIIVGAVLLAAAATPLSAAEHTLMPSPQTVHIGHFDATIKPVLTVESGDTVALVTSDHLDPAVTDQSGVVPPSAVPEYTRAINREVKDRGPSPHFLTGPIFVNGAMPGDVLEVRILDVQLAIPYGYNQHRPGAGERRGAQHSARSAASARHRARQAELEVRQLRGLVREEVVGRDVLRLRQ